MSDDFEVYRQMSALPVPALLELAVGDPEGPKTWPAIAELHSRGNDPLIFDTAKALTRHKTPQNRAAGASILGQFDYSTKTHADDCVAMLKAMLADPDPVVLSAAAHGLGHRYGHDACDDLLKLANHPDADVRYATVHALNASEDPRSTTTLITLSRDPESCIRDWATFGLSVLRRGADQMLVQALIERLTDEDEEVRMEALGGLAERKHPRALIELMQLLSQERGDVMAGHLDAAKDLADPALFELLEALRPKEVEAEPSYWSGCLEEAIKASKPI